MDWILLTYILRDFFGLLLLLAIFGILGAVLYCVIMIAQDVDENRAKKSLLVFARKFCFAAVIISAAWTLASLPDLMVKANVARIKLRYTDIKTVQKLEAEAGKVVDRLDKLIEKEIGGANHG
jgi:small-conductance mechanosensitive channel